MKAKLSLFIILAVLSIGTNSEAYFVNLTGPTSSVQIGDSFTVDVILNGAFTGTHTGSELLAFGFDVLVSDPLVVSFDSAVTNPLFSNDSSFLPNTDVAGMTFPGVSGTSGEANTFLLATLNMTALSIGSSYIDIMSSLNDPNEGLFDYDLQGYPGQYDISTQNALSVTVENSGGNPPSAVPLPGIIWLLGPGLFGILGLERKRTKHLS